MVSNWLITGGCGFIGTSMIKKLIELNPEVNIRVLDNLSVGTRADLTEVNAFKEVKLQDITDSPSGIELVVGDIRNEKTCLDALVGVDVILHLAANTGVPNSVANPRLDMECNVVGTFNMLEAARHNDIKRFIFASSGAPAGEIEPPIHEELPAHPVSPYGSSKLAGEGYCSSYFKTFGIDTVALRFGNVYGPGSAKKSSVVAKFIKQAMSGETLAIYGNGKQTRDFIYIDDLLEAIRLAATQQNIGGEVFQIATNKETTMLEMVETLLPLLSKEGFDNISVSYEEKRKGDVLRNYSDTSKAAEILGWKVATALPKGLSSTVKWFANG
jgi:UDP-glucose 4-epimerase